jgi:hypothetical protein
MIARIRFTVFIYFSEKRRQGFATRALFDRLPMAVKF